MKTRILFTGLMIAGSVAGAQSPAASSSAQTKVAATYKKEIPAKLAKKAKISEEAAAAVALSKVPGGKIQGVELEEEDGAFIYSYDIKVAGKSGVEEVHVDAMTGTVLKSEHESDAAMNAAAEKEEKDAEKAKATKAPAKVKKPPMAQR